MTRYLWGASALLVLLLLVIGCSSAATRAKKPTYMGLFGFNYTDRYLRFVRVDGSYLGGLDAYTNGGSSSMGRSKFDGGSVSVRVQWEEGNQYDLARNSYISDGHAIARDTVVQIKQPYPNDASTLVLHFFPDGSVEGELVQRDRDKWNLRRLPMPKGHVDYESEY